ncbi:DUF6221 family protein [Streptomyces sp. NPDC004031]
MDDLVVFLRARLEEEAERAQAAGAAEWSLQEHEGDTVLIYDSHGEPVVYDEGWPSASQARHIVDHSPARVLAEVEAKRRILNARDAVAAGDDGYGAAALGDVVVQLLALPYADHPDYQQEWRP